LMICPFVLQGQDITGQVKCRFYEFYEEIHK
jgi:hypothetical protein